MKQILSLFPIAVAVLLSAGSVRAGPTDFIVESPVDGKVFKLSEAKGKYVAPAPIEDRLVMHPAIEACIVTGANLPREQMRDAMADSSLDAALPGPALKAQQQAIRNGHCGLLPESQITPMTRVQIARDRAMAATLAQLVQPGKTVVLIAGVGHVDRDTGVPRHLPAGLVSRSVELPRPPAPRRDYCEDMRRSMKAKQDKPAT